MDNKDTTSPISLRRARAQDLPALADVAAQAMLEDELFDYICPYRYEYHSDYRREILDRLRPRFVKPGFMIVVAVEDEGTTSELIRGYALWQRIGSLSSSFESPMEIGNASLEKEIQDTRAADYPPDRSVDPDRLEHYKASVRDCFPYDEYPELLWLETLAVDPKYQRRGIGRRLVQWGMLLSQLEKVPIGLEAGIQGSALYETLGFQTLNTLELIPGIPMRAMLYDNVGTDVSQHP
ncbi:acyl-CoA N-acyltransferase [Penicillium sp. DV-2018c]|nr:acyl-CoA N-acyltransferase [Penicillium sp. DV-2018c]